MTHRTVVLKMVLSLDGFATSPDGTHDWMFRYFGDDGGWNQRALDAAGTHAMGRRSYEIMGPHWQATEGPVATAMNGTPKAVFSRTLERADWGPVEVFRDVGAGIAELRSRPDAGTVLVHGGPTLASALTPLGLVDEYHLTRVPIAIGRGRSPFATLQEHLALELVDEHRIPTGAVGQVLRPTR
ncbi:dihydrofolate reductase family protein [Patulibacter sp. SYSU D01012]|uniref:dihydrofolate reductase family protein n=1 Tax=Patulibacter sp. SYSU D01012 TaxID=2817381 RepID=UPI001B310F87|nr:dihydrofolate reductase family protein [Patulibacter sp. SYSU D01012]